MMYLKIIKHLSKEDICTKVRQFEEKYRMSLREFEKNVVKGHEQELDKKGIYNEYEEWKYYTNALKQKKLPLIEEGSIRPLKPIKPALEVFTEKRLNILEILNKRPVTSINQLSRIMKRDRGAVHTDLEILNRENLVTLEKKGRAVIPVANASRIEIGM